MERLQKFLSRAGVASRRHAETMIVDGRVKVNGKVVTELGTRVDAAKDLVLLDGKLVSVSSERKYFLLYKPPGVVTTLSDPEGRPTVADYAQDTGGRVFPVGRLDYDAEGALLLTDDGDLANKLMHPSHQVPRVYLAKVKGMPDEPSLQKLVDGVRLEDGMAHAVEAKIFNKAERNTWVKLVVTEGRQHLVKRLCAAIGHPVVRLFRPAHAGISVHGLSPGALRALTNDEIRRVKAAADGTTSEQPALYLPARRHGHAAPGFEPEEGESRDQGAPPPSSFSEPDDGFDARPSRDEDAPAERAGTRGSSDGGRFPPRRSAEGARGGERSRGGPEGRREDSRGGGRFASRGGAADSRGGRRGDDARGGGRLAPRGADDARGGGRPAPRGADDARGGGFRARGGSDDARSGASRARGGGRFAARGGGEGRRGGAEESGGSFGSRGGAESGGRFGSRAGGEGRRGGDGEARGGGRFPSRSGGDGRRGGGEGRFAPRGEDSRGGGRRGEDARGGGRFASRGEGSRGGGRFAPRGGDDSRGGGQFPPRAGGADARPSSRFAPRGEGPRGGDSERGGGRGRFGGRDGDGRKSKGRAGDRGGEGRSAEGGRKFGGARGGGRFGKPGGKFSAGRKPGPRGSGSRSSPRKPRGSW